MPRLIDVDEIKLPQGFFEKVDNVPKFYKWLDEQPTVDAEPVRHGHWVEGNNFHWYSNSCSCCGYTRTTDIKSNGWNQWKYCPMCGAKMDVETGNTYSIGKIELPTGVFRQIYDEGRKEDE